MVLQLEIVKIPNRPLGTLEVADTTTVNALKKQISNNFGISPERQSIKCSPRGKTEDDSTLVTQLSFETPNKVFVKDLGPQIGWDTVFYLEYSGPIVLYGLLYLLPQCFYGSKNWEGKIRDGAPQFPFDLFPVYRLNQLCGGDPAAIRVSNTAFFAGILWTIHYAKRILETAFVHRFSHGTMPIANLFKNSAYYWGFALYIAYHINHPLHTPPPALFFYLGSAIFIISELGNLSIHLLLRDLRPEGTNVRKIPVANSNPLTKLYDYVSCPNYTYEFGSWVGFTLLTGCLPAFIFTLAGLYQMSVWAVGKHKKYISEFPNYPRRRKAILPFLF